MDNETITQPQGEVRETITQEAPREHEITIKELFEKAKEIRKPAKITKIEIKNSKEVFGDSAIRTDRDVAMIYSEYGREAHALPQGIAYVDGKWKVTDELNALKSLRNPNSWFGRFFRKYEQFPIEGQEVILTINTRGFTVIEV